MILDRFKLDGKVAIVTGASTGLGQGICYGLSEAGAKIVGVDYVEMDETKATIEANGGEFVGVVANLMTLEPIEGIINTAIEKFGRIDILVNNAGIIRREDAIDFSEKNWDDVIAINQNSISSTKLLQKSLSKSGGKIINIASCFLSGRIRVPSYTASKVLLRV